MIKNDEIETSSEPMIYKHEKFASSTKSASLVTFTAAQGFPLSTHRRSTQGLSFLGFGFGFSPTSTAGTPPLCAPFFILSSLNGQKSSGDIIHQGANQWNITPKEFRNNMRSKLQSSFILRKCLCLSIFIIWYVYNYIYTVYTLYIYIMSFLWAFWTSKQKKCTKLGTGWTSIGGWRSGRWGSLTQFFQQIGIQKSHSNFEVCHFFDLENDHKWFHT